MSSLLHKLLNRITTGQPSQPEHQPLRAMATPAEAVWPKILVISFNPIVPVSGGRSLTEALGWHDASGLADAYAADLAEASGGYYRCQIADRLTVDDFPQKADGYRYSGQEYLAAWRARRGFHQPDWMDYTRVIDEFGLVKRVRDGQIDEVWLFGFPYAGFYESRMAGPGAFWCNAPPLEGTARAGRRFVIMGFNYERGVGEMLESFGHRAESILSYVFRARRGPANLWERFTRYEKSHPGRAEVGTVHFAPNSRQDYDWGNRSPVLSRCDNWYRYPDLSGEPRLVDCRQWGNGDIRKHHLWWLSHFPRLGGSSNGILDNWWAYVVDPQLSG